MLVGSARCYGYEISVAHQAAAAYDAADDPPGSGTTQSGYAHELTSESRILEDDGAAVRLGATDE